MLHSQRSLDDQAATLRRLFARRPVQVLPVWIGSAFGPDLPVWMARLARAFVQHGERTLVVDATRLYLAAAMGLRARFDLLHALTGECSLHRLMMEAGPDLWVVPALRALDRAAQSSVRHQASEQPLTLALQRLVAHCHCDRILLFFMAPHAALLPGGCDWVVPVSRGGVRPLMMDVQRLNTRLDIAHFRLLFLDMESASASTLSARFRTLTGHAAPRFLTGGQVRTRDDWIHVMRAASGWRSALLTKNAMETWI